MDKEKYQRRTKQLALRVIRVVESLPADKISDVIGKQLLHSATSVGANYRAACRGRSSAELIAKLGIVLEETNVKLQFPINLIFETLYFCLEVEPVS